MSKLIDKAKGINFDDVDEPAAAPPSPAPLAAKPRTAIGAISASLALGRTVEAENRALKDRLKSFEDATVVEFLDPLQVRPSRFANRHELSFGGADFEALKAEIASAGRNVQPIKVRALAPTSASASAQGAGGQVAAARYEIAFGHRRHRACLELGLPVAAIVEDLSDAQLFAEMDRENRERANLSPWEQGAMYKRALEAGLFPSLRKLASALGVQAGNASTAVQLASLPDAVVAAFESPLVLQYRWAAQLQAALDRDRKGVLARAAELAAGPVRPPARQVLQRLLAEPASVRAARGSSRSFSVDDRQVGSLEKDASGAITVRLASGVLDAARERKLGDFLARLLAG